MFELFLNAVKIATSPDGRSSAAAIVELFNKSPEWMKEITIVEAHVPYQERERAILLGELVIRKMLLAAFGSNATSKFEVVYRELVDNAFEHGMTDKANSVVKLVFDLTPVYCATTIFNPKGEAIDLGGWMTAGAAHLRSHDKPSRGRGLLICVNEADVLEAVEPNGIKFIIFKDQVVLDLKTISIGSKRGSAVLVLSGHGNPSLGLDFRTFTGVVEVEKRADHHALCRYPEGCSSTTGSRTARRSARWISLSPASPPW